MNIFSFLNIRGVEKPFKNQECHDPVLPFSLISRASAQAAMPLELKKEYHLQEFYVEQKRYVLDKKIENFKRCFINFCETRYGLNRIQVHRLLKSLHQSSHLESFVSTEIKRARRNLAIQKMIIAIFVLLFFFGGVVTSEGGYFLVDLALIFSWFLPIRDESESYQVVRSWKQLNKFCGTDRKSFSHFAIIGMEPAQRVEKKQR